MTIEYVNVVSRSLSAGRSRYEKEEKEEATEAAAKESATGSER